MSRLAPIYLRSRRERRELTQEDLERLSGVTQNTISRLERDKRARPTAATHLRLANALDVDPNRLCYGPDPRRRRPLDGRRRFTAAAHPVASARRDEVTR